MKISNLLYMGALSTLALMSCTNNDDNSEWEFQVTLGMQTTK